MDPKKLSPEELEQLVHRELRALPPRRVPAGFEARLQARFEARALAPEKLEALVHRELRALPPRRAPHTLEARVLAAIESRAHVAWWHRSWSYWPLPVRAAFAACATVFAGAVVAGSYALFAGFDPVAVASHAGERLGVLVQLWHAATWVADFGSRQVASIPPLFLYGGLVFVAGLYTALVGLGAAAYRTLCLSR
jgi:hypothetical protein